jgi:two-component system, chemotaxis family, protein-glutamate methylesterase/glutaminase
MRDIIVIGASAGGVETLIQLVHLLPRDLPAAVFIVIHTPPNSPGLLPVILSRKGPLPAVHPEDGQPFKPGKIYVAPPDQHMIFFNGAIRLSSGPKENLLRPAVDTLFRSAALAFGARVAGVVLSGTRNDGTAGMAAIQTHGGITIVQDPEEAIFPGMPENVLSSMKVNYVLPITEIAATLEQLAREPVRDESFFGGKAMTQHNHANLPVTQADRDQYMNGGSANLPRSLLTCPGCGGVLWEVNEGTMTRYFCQIGHVFSEDSLLSGQGETLEGVLWSAVRALEERAAIAARLSSRARQNGSEHSAHQFEQQAQDAERNASLIRQIVSNGQTEALNQVEKED